MIQGENPDDTSINFFPQKLMAILSDPANLSAIAWLPHGKAFVISNRKKFGNDVLPKYFRGSKPASFIRKLNRWGFKRCTKGPDIGAYYHEFFQRDNENMCVQMYCMNDRYKFATSQGTTESETTPSAESNKKHRIENKEKSKDPRSKIPTVVLPAGTLTHEEKKAIIASRMCLRFSSRPLNSPILARELLLLSLMKRQAIMNEQLLRGLLQSERTEQELPLFARS